MRAIDRRGFVGGKQQREKYARWSLRGSNRQARDNTGKKFERWECGVVQPFYSV